MKYCLDTSSLITPWRFTYPPDVFKGLWDKLAAEIAAANIVSVDLVYKELQKGNDDLFAWLKGEQTRDLRAFLLGMGLPAIRFHDLRASWATILLGQGVEPVKVMKMGGWKDLDTMMIYVRKAGIDVAGALNGLTLHQHRPQIGEVLQLKLGSGSNP